MPDSINYGVSSKQRNKNDMRETMASREIQPLNCPECGSDVGVRHVHFPHFRCPECKTELGLSGLYRFQAGLLGAVIAFAFCYAVGLRSVVLIAVAAVLSLVAGSLLTVFGLPIVRPKLERYFSYGRLNLRG